MDVQQGLMSLSSWRESQSCRHFTSERCREVELLSKAASKTEGSPKPKGKSGIASPFGIRGHLCKTPSGALGMDTSLGILKQTSGLAGSNSAGIH